VPGQFTQDYRTHNAAKLFKAGTDIVFQVHYTPVGKEVVDRPRIGFTVAKQPPQRVYVSLGMSAPSDAKSFAIPPNDGNWESPPAEATFAADVELVWMFPHMHVRGKDMTYRLIYPDGKTETILNVPKYDFNWQLGYDLAKPIVRSEGHTISRQCALRQFRQQQVQSRSGQDGVLRRHDLGRDDVPFFSVVIDKNVDPKSVIRIVRGRRSDGA
jgi:hypothetical protein